jgi:hypothetical protein
MSDKLTNRPKFLNESAFLARITQHDGRAIEDALAGPTLFDPGVSLSGGVVEATYAAAEPPLLKRLREDGVPYIVDPQTARFVGERFMQVEQFDRIPFKPDAPITPEALTPSVADELARAVMRFEQGAGASCYVAAGMPYADVDLDGWIRRNDRLLSASCAANGTGDTKRRPLIAQVLPGRKAIASPKLIVNRLMDHPIDAVYVQPLRLNPARDSVEKLTQYVEFLLALKTTGLSVVAGRVGAFGLVLQALGIPSFDSGLCQAEAFDLASLNRPLTERERKRRSERGGGGDRRIYIEQLKTTLTGRHAAAILANRQLRSRFTCSLGCCQHRGFDELPDRRRQHYLWVRQHEVNELRDCPTDATRVDWIHERLRDARGAGRAVRKALAGEEDDLPRFEHLDRWIGVLGRETELQAVA